MIGSDANNTTVVRPHHYDSTNSLYLYYFYYEPTATREMNTLTIQVASANSSLHAIGYVSSDDVFYEATNLKIDGSGTSVPVSFATNTTDYTFTFDTVTVGPGAPLKFVLRNTGDFMAIRRLY